MVEKGRAGQGRERKGKERENNKERKKPESLVLPVQCCCSGNSQAPESALFSQQNLRCHRRFATLLKPQFPDVKQ